METRVTKKQKENFEHLDTKTTLIGQRISSTINWQQTLKEELYISNAEIKTSLKTDQEGYFAILTTMMSNRLNLIKEQIDDSLTSRTTEFNGLTDKHKVKLEKLTSMILNTTNRLNRLQEEFNE